MVGWRKAFFTSKDQKQEAITIAAGSSEKSSFGEKFRVLPSNSNPSTPRLNSDTTSSPRLVCRTTTPIGDASPDETVTESGGKFHCRMMTGCARTVMTNNTTKSPRLASISSSPRSSSPFSLFRSTLRFSKLKSRCGICLQSVKAGQGMAIFTAECSHIFHFPCIAGSVGNLDDPICPVCASSWKELPLLSKRKIHYPKIPASKPYPKDVMKPQHQLQQHTLKVYDDDEPLMSSTPVSRFNPIFESDETDEEEFGGFFVSSTLPPLTNNLNFTDSISKNLIAASLSPEAAIVTSGRNSETYAVVLKLKAPSTPSSSSLPDPSRRAPIDLVMALDLGSGSKLQILKSAMRLLISTLSSNDRLSLVAFSANSKRLLPLRRMTNHGRRFARRIVETLTPGEGTSPGVAVRKAVKIIEDRREKNPVASIVLVSEGRPSPVVSSTRLTDMEIPVHAVTLGEGGACESDSAFVKCIGGLLTVAAEDVDVKVEIGSGTISISGAGVSIPAVYPCSGRPTVFEPKSIRVGHLFAEEVRELLVEVKAHTSSACSGIQGAHLSVRCAFVDPMSKKAIRCEEQLMTIPRPQAARSSSSGPAIGRLRNLFIAVRAVAEARGLGESNALRLLLSARAMIGDEAATRELDAEISEIQRRRRGRPDVGEALTPTSAWRAAERLAKVAKMRKSLNRVSDLHGFENARF